MTELLMSDGQVLMEVPPSKVNVALPPEGEMSHWVAMADGGFKECPEEAVERIRALSKPRPSTPNKTIVKRRAPTRKARKRAKASRARDVHVPEVMPRKKDRAERHPMLHKRVFVLWPANEDPLKEGRMTPYYGTVVKVDSSKASSMRIHYEDGEMWWEPAVDVHAAEHQPGQPGQPAP